MSDADMDAIRQRRLAELAGGSAASPSAAGGQQQQQLQQQQDQAARAAEEEESRRTIMGQILDPEARERLSRIALVRPERERSLQELLVRMAKSGQLRGRVTDAQLLGLLDQVAQAEQGHAGGAASAGAKSKITFNRRQDKSALSDDDEDDGFDAYDGRARTASSKATKSVAANNDDDDDDIFDL